MFSALTFVMLPTSWRSATIDQTMVVNNARYRYSADEKPGLTPLQ